MNEDVIVSNDYWLIIQPLETQPVETQGQPLQTQVHPLGNDPIRYIGPVMGNNFKSLLKRK